MSRLKYEITDYERANTKWILKRPPLKRFEHLNFNNITKYILENRLDIISADTYKFIELDEKIKQFALTTAVVFNKFDIVKYICETGYITDNALYYAVIDGNINMIKYLVPKYEYICHNVTDAIIGDGNINLLKYLMPKNNIGDYEYALLKAKQYKHDNIVNFLEDNKPLTPEYITK